MFTSKAKVSARRKWPFLKRCRSKVKKSLSFSKHQADAHTPTLDELAGLRNAATPADLDAKLDRIALCKSC